VTGLFDDLRWRGLVYQVTDDALAETMAAGPVAVYHGIDVTADSLHVGSMVGVIALRRLQQAGHRPLALLGGGTTLIGDPSGRRTERPVLSAEQIEANATGIRAQLERFLDFGPGPSGATLLNNADWLSSTPLTDFLRHVGKHFTVNAMLAKESVRSRLEDPDRGISFTEFSYMLLQAYDFLHLFDAHRCRLQIGGSDQWGNITAGIDLVRRVRDGKAYGFTWPLVTKADGTKFGKSQAGNVWLDPARTSPYEFFQFWMGVDDHDVGRYLRLLTFLDRGRIEELDAETAAQPERRTAPLALARELTAMVHGPDEAARAAHASAALFSGDLSSLDEAALMEVFAEAPSTTVTLGRLDGDGASLVELLAQSGLVASRSAARQAIAQGGVSLNGRREGDVERRVVTADLLAGGYLVLRRGKRSYHLLCAR